MTDARKAVISALAKAEGAYGKGLLEAVFAHAPIGIAFWDADLRYRRVNAELAAMNGLSIEAHLGRRPSELLPELGPRLEEVFRRVLDSGKPLRDIDVSGRTPAAPEVERHWLASYMPVHGDDGTVAGLAGIVVEITREREAHDLADAALQQGRSFDAELRALYGALPVGVAFLSPEMRYLRVNETLARLNGRSVEAHLGASIEDVLGEHAPTLRPALEKVLATGESLDLHATLTPPGQDAPVTLEATYFAVTDAGGRPLGVGGVVSDVTRRHALELEQARLLEEAERSRQRISILAEAGARMAESMEWEATLQAVVRSAVPDVADWSSLTVVEPGGGLRVAAVAHADPERERLAWQLVEQYPQPRESEAGTAHVIRTGEMLLAEDIPAESVGAGARDERHRELLESLNVEHVVIVPLLAPAGVLGAMSFILGDSGRRFSPEDVTLIRGLAARAALHLQNARLYRERSHVAETLEASLRPHALPVVPGVQAAARFLPAGDHNSVGGDFYDVFEDERGAWTVVVGDVAGKGPEAAAITATARHTLRAVSMLEDSPGARMRLLNRVLYGAETPGNFCSAFCLRLEPGADGVDLRYASAGHPPPMVVRADGTIEELDGAVGPLAGATPDGSYAEAEGRLAPGDLLLIYTDGVTEVSTHDLRRGEEELRAVLAATAGAPAGDVAAAVERRAVQLQHGAPRDDIAIVALRAMAGGAPGVHEHDL